MVVMLFAVTVMVTLTLSLSLSGLLVAMVAMSMLCGGNIYCGRGDDVVVEVVSVVVGVGRSRHNVIDFVTCH